MSSYTVFSNYICTHAETLAREIVDGVIQELNLKLPEWEREQAVDTYIGLLEFLGNSLVKDRAKMVPEELIEWSERNSEMQVSTGGEFSELVVRYPPTRRICNDIVTRISIELNLTVSQNAYIIKRINEMLDVSLNETFFSFKRLSDERQGKTQKKLLEVSTPIVPIMDGIVVVPLIGHMDMMVTEHIMNSVVQEIDNMDVNHVIADFSGALIINPQVAEAFREIGRTLRLMGLNIIITGMRPDTVFSVVEAGIELSSMESYATVKQAVESTLQKYST
ncbi:STAS domain-containing protein [Virgibacillus kekensis]|uniref:STAS domain-containing protein n=1 Tax=Virgibacillus kekensis TaxID=202261 RepID=A0ABV9DHV0_9BACI